MFLARLLLNPMSADVRRDIYNWRALSHTLSSAFSASEQQRGAGRRGFLYRLDIDSKADSIILHILSRVGPNWSALPQSYLASDPKNRMILEIGPLYDGIQAGHIFRFSVRALPKQLSHVGLKEVRGGSWGQWVSVCDLTSQIEWFLGEARLSGFRVLAISEKPGRLSLEVTTEDIPAAAYASFGGNGQAVRPADFRGILQVTDAERFRRALTRGIGCGQAYGFGLILLAPPRLFGLTSLDMVRLACAGVGC